MVENMFDIMQQTTASSDPDVETSSVIQHALDLPWPMDIVFSEFGVDETPTNQVACAVDESLPRSIYTARYLEDTFERTRGAAGCECGDGSESTPTNLSKESLHHPDEPTSAQLYMMNGELCSRRKVLTSLVTLSNTIVYGLTRDQEKAHLRQQRQALREQHEQLEREQGKKRRRERLRQV